MRNPVKVKWNATLWTVQGLLALLAWVAYGRLVDLAASHSTYQ